MKQHYQQPKQSLWQGRDDVSPGQLLYQAMDYLDLTQELMPRQAPAYALLGFCSHEGVRRNQGRVGAAEGPKAIREALAKLPKAGAFPVFDAGDVVCEEGDDLESAQAALGQAVAKLLNAGYRPILLGGGHEIAWGHYQGIAASEQGADKLGIINFDAHFDLRCLNENNQGTSGTPFLQIAQQRRDQGLAFAYFCVGVQPSANSSDLFATAKSLGVHSVTADIIHSGGGVAVRELLERLALHPQIYLSICLDVLASAQAPGVSAPQPLGINHWQLLPIAQHVLNTGKVVSMDIAELCPRLDQDNQTAKLAAQLIWYALK